MKKLAVLGVVAVLLVFTGASVARAAEPGQSWIEDTPIVGCIPGLPLGFSICGTSGSYAGHVVLEPIVSVNAPEGLKEDSRFTVSGFTGYVCFGFLCATTSSPIDAMISVHFGDEPNKPVATVVVTSGDICLGSCLVSPPIKLLKVVGGVPVVHFK